MVTLWRTRLRQDSDADPFSRAGLGPLWEATRDLHDAAERHPVAKRMSSGTTKPKEWADWLHAHWTIQKVLDPHLPFCVRRSNALALDLSALLPVRATPSPSAVDFAAGLTSIKDILGAAYLTIGAHRRGGRVIEKAMLAAGNLLPSRHIVFDDPKSAELFVKHLRDVPEIASGARKAFSTLIAVMDEIEDRR
ncbi:hypothetical protein C8D95_10121 [Silicimonas algicola]|uniref:Heme oxygenase n=2 Tax=Silicimonas algicola TaxID=1826607 RepID=A0A316GE54_9RHOB|nr:hypothetical protein C8D95_10121 [Silicimonas algicola]